LNGAGIFVNEGSADLINSTITGNQALDYGGGIYIKDAQSSHYLRNATIAYNSTNVNDDGTGNGGGIYVEPSFYVAFNFKNTILSNNARRNGAVYLLDDCKGRLNSRDYNLIQTISGCTIEGITTHNQTGSNAGLEPLQDNGGPTLTHYPGENSPVIDAGDPGGCDDMNGILLATDQRGVYRHMDGDGDGIYRCDIGAVEFVHLFDIYLPLTIR
jgi:hypothetical protein